MAIGWTTYYVGVTQIFKQSRWAKHATTIASLAMVMLILPILWQLVGEVYDDFKDGDYPYREEGQTWMATGR